MPAAPDPVALAAAAAAETLTGDAAPSVVMVASAAAAAAAPGSHAMRRTMVLAVLAAATVARAAAATAAQAAAAAPVLAARFSTMSALCRSAIAPFQVTQPRVEMAAMHLARAMVVTQEKVAVAAFSISMGYSSSRPIRKRGSRLPNLWETASP